METIDLVKTIDGKIKRGSDNVTECLECFRKAGIAASIFFKCLYAKNDDIEALVNKRWLIECSIKVDGTLNAPASLIAAACTIPFLIKL